MSNIRFITVASLLIIMSLIFCCLWGCGVPRREHEEIVALHLKVEALQAENQRLKKQLATAGVIYQQGRPAGGQHKLILLSLSSHFSHEQQQAISNTLFHTLTQLKKPVNCSLQVIQPGRRLHTILDAKMLADLPKQGQEDSIQGKLDRGLQFSASDLMALDDLELVDLQLRNMAPPTTGQVLYLTDNARLSTDVQEIPNKQRGIPLAWREDGIALTVLTTKACTAWQYVGATQCIPWQGESETLQNTLANFLKDE